MTFVTCHACINDNDCVQSMAKSYLEDPFSHRNVTTYGSYLQYRCPIAREFDVRNDITDTEATFNMTCKWDETWTPAVDEVPTCVCKF